ncbi:MAG: M15 family metallopeptidase [Saprospiraceae bacterium]|nr:M15 family metallopeptidase [Saprospiraceae bacterium]MBK9258037.1 M15 family metallopeptidase [Saprospiraceae bacterium]
MNIDNFLISGKFDPVTRDEFIEFKSDLDQDLLYLQLDVYVAFLRMKEFATKDSIQLSIVSAFRSYERQQEIWEGKWQGSLPVDGMDLNIFTNDPMAKAQKILEYTAPPGFSRHHWGTDIDINSVEPDYFDTEEGFRTYQWLLIHAGKFGFCQTYTAYNALRPGGFREEKWHWSYEPISYQIWSTQIKQLDHLQIGPFLGSEIFNQINLLEYIKNVNHCSELISEK